MVVQTGVGPDKAAAACRDVMREHPAELVVSAGLACALVPAGIGDLLIGTEVRMAADLDDVARSSGRSCTGEVVTAAVRAAERAGLPAKTGPFVTVPRILWRSSDKQALARNTGAIGADMESAVLAETAASRNAAFAIVRSVSDLVDEDLPVDFNLFLKPAGWVKGLAICLAAPSCPHRLLRLRTQMCTASDRTSRFFAHFLDDRQ